MLPYYQTEDDVVKQKPDKKTIKSVVKVKME